jgi:hypothetical protein
MEGWPAILTENFLSFHPCLNPLEKGHLQNLVADVGTKLLVVLL